MTAKPVNAFFEVEREQLFRKDGIYSEYDALYRKDNGKQISVVNKGYNLVTHKKAVSILDKVLAKANVQDVEKVIETSRTGNYMNYRVKLPKFAFDAEETGVKGTAYDSGKGEVYMPVMIARNSYNKLSSLSFDVELWRQVCKNGLCVKDNTIESLRFTHSGNIDFGGIERTLFDNVDIIMNTFQHNYSRLNGLGTYAFVEELFVNNSFTSKFYIKHFIEALAGKIDIDYKEVEDSTKIEVNNVSVKEDMTAYAFWCILTEVITHRITNLNERHRLSQKVAKIFMK